MIDHRHVDRAFRAKLAPAFMALMIAVGISAAMAGQAQAVAPEITTFSASPSTTQAGGHPDVTFELRFTADENFAARVTEIHFPTGFIGNVHVAPTCTLTEFNLANCPVDSQIAVFSAEPAQAGLIYNFPAYNMETSPDQAGLVGFIVPLFNLPVFLELSGRTDSDYGLDTASTPLLRGITNVTGELWGVPADPVHDVLRFVTPLEGIGACISKSEGCLPGSEFESATHAEPTIPPRPFLQNPTECGVPLTSSADVEYYGGAVAHAEDSWPAATGCKQLSFNPSLTVKPTTGQADTASGVDFAIKVPQTQSPTTPSPSELRTQRLVFPEGFTINPNAADGKVVCSDESTGIGTRGPASCPEHSKVGTVEIDVASLPAPISGAIYLMEPRPGERFRLLLTASGFATHIKLLGVVRPDPKTGQQTISFEDLPQQPLQEVSTHFFGSERGLLATPTQCGTFEVKGEFVPWDSELTTRHTTSYMTIDSGPGGSPCPNGPRPFAPRMQAGTSNSTAGMHAPFSLALSRQDGEQNLSGLQITTPPGFAATLKGVPYCPEAAIAGTLAGNRTGLEEQASPTCPLASQVGTATTGAGAGTHPLYVPGKVYLAGPYKGFPLSLLVVVPAVSGPYDLGTVAVRAAIDVDPRTARVSVTSDPFPQILEGVPLRTRSILVNLDRPGFTLNPTNCDPFSIDTQISGTEGAIATPSAHFQAANCSELGFSPKLSLKLTGSTKRRGNPALKATLSTNPGEANFSKVITALPKSLLVDNAHIGTVCTRPQFAANACPAGSLVGEAQATTALLDSPLKGSVYLRSAGKLPDLAIDLEGQFDVELVGHIDSPKKGGLRTTFEALPDAPVTSFTLNLLGASKGLLENSEDLCKFPAKAKIQMTGQNGAQIASKAKLKTSCSAARKSKKTKKRSRGARR